MREANSSYASNHLWWEMSLVDWNRARERRRVSSTRSQIFTEILVPQKGSHFSLYFDWRMANGEQLSIIFFRNNKPFLFWPLNCWQQLWVVRLVERIVWTRCGRRIYLPKNNFINWWHCILIPQIPNSILETKEWQKSFCFSSASRCLKNGVAQTTREFH